MTGILIQCDDRPDIVFDNGTLYGGLHCGECFDVYCNRWLSVRLEYYDNWVIIYRGKAYPIRYGTLVRMQIMLIETKAKHLMYNAQHPTQRYSI